MSKISIPFSFIFLLIGMLYLDGIKLLSKKEFKLEVYVNLGLEEGTKAYRLKVPRQKESSDRLQPFLLIDHQPVLGKEKEEPRKDWIS